MRERMTNSWLNGEATEHIAISDRSVLFGDSCFSTVAIRDGEPELWSRHRERLQLTAARLRFPALDIARLEQEVGVACQGVGRGILRVTLTRGSGGRGYGLPAQSAVQRLLLRRDWPTDIETRAREGVALRWCETSLSPQPLLAGLKHGNRLEQVLARAEWQDSQIAEGLMCDDQGHVVEATTSNVFFRSARGPWCTPALHRCGVAGVMRAEILAQLSLRGEPAQVAEFRPVELLQASEWFVCNAVVGIWPVVALAEQRWPIGEHTRLLQRLIARNLG